MTGESVHYEKVKGAMEQAVKFVLQHQADTKKPHVVPLSRVEFRWGALQWQGFKTFLRPVPSGC